LKNPLASIRTAAEMMASTSSEEERRRFLDLMTRDVERLERLVSGLREVALVEGQMEREPTEAVDVAALVAGIVEGVNATTQRGVRVTCAADGSPVVRASRERLVQLFGNLIGNAISFAPDGTAIDLSVTSCDGYCTISIEDRGPGIPEAHLQRVFERFFSYRPGERRRDHVGLGLAIARQIVESYGGSITASNRQGGGARFDVRLPLISIRSGVVSA
jgi:two-component system sensor histidine kinase ChvG